MRTRPRDLVTLVAAAVLAGGCDPIPQDYVLGIAADGAVQGLVFLDRDGDREWTAGAEPPIGGVEVRLVSTGTARALAIDTSDQSGLFGFDGVPVGDYRVVVDSAALSRVLRDAVAPDERVVVNATDTAVVRLPVGYPLLTVAGARGLVAGRRVLLQGAALNGWATFGDSTVHLADATGAIRATAVEPAELFEGDTVRIQGTLAFLDGQPVLTDAAASVLRTGPAPAPIRVTAAEARSARSGSLDAALVSIPSLTVTDTTRAAEGLWLEAADATGSIRLLLDRDAGFAYARYEPGVLLDAVGVLVPVDGSRAWILKPRSSADLVRR